MVKEKLIDIFKCPYCNRKYDNEDDAEDCRDDCLEKDDIISDEESRYSCEYCEKEYNHEGQAKSCETYHINRQDNFYLEYEFKRGRSKLDEHAKNPYQDKLSTW